MQSATVDLDDTYVHKRICERDKIKILKVQILKISLNPEYISNLTNTQI